MGLKNKSRAVFILLRPYSLPGLFLLYYVAKVMATGSLGLGVRDAFAFVPIFLAWTFMTMLLEAEHKHSNREKIPYSYPFVALIATIVLVVALAGFAPLIPLIFFMLFTYMYTKKNSIPIFGNISFVTRGFMEISLFFLSLSLFYHAYPQAITVLFGFAILLITSARNLIGDIRDTKFDEVTFSVRFGNRIAYIVSMILYGIGGYVLFGITQAALGVVFPIILMIALLFIADNGNMLHRLAVMLSSIIIAAYILFITGNSYLLLLLNVMFLGVLCNLVFYNLVPRRSNPQDIQTAFGIAPWLTKTTSNKRLA